LRSAASWRVVRYRRTPENDRRDIRHQRPSAPSDRTVVRSGAAVGNNPDGRVADHFLFRIGRGEFGRPYRQRNISSGDKSVGDRLFLRAGNRRRRQPFTAFIQLADRVRIKLAGSVSVTRCLHCCFSSQPAQNGAERFQVARWSAPGPAWLNCKLALTCFDTGISHPPVTASTASLILAMAKFPTCPSSTCGMFGISSAATTASTIAGPSTARASAIAAISSFGFRAIKP
jgi:hypothetical protein